MTPREAIARYLDSKGWQHTNPNGPSVTYFKNGLRINQSFIHVNGEDIIIANIGGGEASQITILYSDPDLFDALDQAINQSEIIATRNKTNHK